MHSFRSRIGALGVLAALSVALGPGAPAGAAVLYRWVDADGIVHYSDRPAPGAEKVQIASAQTYSSHPAASTPRRNGTTAAAPKYSRVAITSPTEGQSFVDTGGKVDAAAVVEPGLASGHQLWFQLDGTRQPDPAGADMTASFEVGRGTHTLAAVVTDEQGHEVLSSAAVTFYVLQHSIAQPPRGPLLTPPKKH